MDRASWCEVWVGKKSKPSWLKAKERADIPTPFKPLIAKPHEFHLGLVPPPNVKFSSRPQHSHVYMHTYTHTHTTWRGGASISKHPILFLLFFHPFFFHLQTKLNSKGIFFCHGRVQRFGGSHRQAVHMVVEMKKKKKYKKGGNRTATSIRTDCVWWRPNRWPGEFRGILRKNVDGWPSVATTHWQHTEFVFNPATTTTITATAATATDEPKK